MPISELTVLTSAGRFAAIDYGGSGADCLLLHGTGQNAASWSPYAQRLSSHCHVVAFDMRGHGQTMESSRDAEQYWRDIAPLVDALEMRDPILIGHSSGAYAATAHVACGGRAGAIVCVDGFTLDARPRSGAPSQRSWSETKELLFQRFRYGWRATPVERDEYLDEVLASAPSDALNVGIDPLLLRSMLERCFVRQNGTLLRRPTLEEIEVVQVPPPDSAIGPYRTIYDKIDVPLLLVWADGGLSAGRRPEIESIAAARRERTLMAVRASHNVPMQRPTELAELTISHLFTG